MARNRNRTIGPQKEKGEVVKKSDEKTPKSKDAVDKNKKVSDKKSTVTNLSEFVLAVVYCIISIASSALIAYYANEYLGQYNMPLYVSFPIIAVSAFLLLYTMGLAIRPVYPKPTHAPVAYATILSLITILLVIGNIYYFRADNFDPETGVAKKYITPGTGKIWHEKPEEVRFDPKTGEKIQVLSREKIKEIERVKKKSERKKRVARGPDYREFKVGRKHEYRINNMKSGESNGFYIRSPRGFPTKQFVTSFGTKVKAVLRDGREFDLSNGKPLPDGDYDFKFVAYEDGARALVWFER